MATANYYGKFGLALMNKEADMNSDTFKVSLHTATYTPDADVHDYFDDATNEVTGTNYTPGGVTIATPTITYDAATNETRWDAGDATWTNVTIAAFRYAVIRDDTPATNATKPLVAYVDLGAQSITAGNVTIQWDALGIAYIALT